MCTSCCRVYASCTFASLDTLSENFWRSFNICNTGKHYALLLLSRQFEGISGHVGGKGDHYKGRFFDDYDYAYE